MKKIAFGLAAAALLAIAAGTAMTAPVSAATASASAGPIIIRDTITTPMTETGLTDDCRPGLTGTIVGIGVLSFQSVETSQGFHIHGTIDGPGRIDWSDGSYTLIESTDHIAFSVVGHGTVISTEAHTDSGDFFSPSGVFQFRQTFQEIKHFTVTNGDVTRVEFERGHFIRNC